MKKEKQKRLAQVAGAALILGAEQYLIFYISPYFGISERSRMESLFLWGGL